MKLEQVYDAVLNFGGRTMYKKIGIAIGSVFLGIVLLFGGFLLYSSIRDYNPGAMEEVTIETNPLSEFTINSMYSISTFNIGYGGLDKEADFFMDGGTMSRAASKGVVEKNMEGIVDTVLHLDPTILLLQEVDIDSSRSYHVDEYAHMQNSLTTYGSSLAYNYIVDWVPVPIFQPMGKVRSGIATFSKNAISKSTRYALPGQESWPVQLFELDRCILETRMPVDNGKELIVVNVHLSAFDEGGKIRQQQLGFLKEYIKNEYDNGNYVIVGGDWNHNLPTTDPSLFTATEDVPFWIQTLPDDFTPEGFVWAVDKTTPTVRTLASSYVPNKNYLAVIDGFLISDNIEVSQVVGTNEHFVHSDHNPVTVHFVLK